MRRAVLEAILEARAKRQAVALVTHMASGDQRIVARSAAAKDTLGSALEEAFRFDQSAMHDEHFVNIQNPPLRLLIIGAVHVAQAIIPMAQQAGYDVIVVDPRGAFATGERFPGVALHVEWPDDIIPQIGLDARTAMMALTHDPRIDDPALFAALKSDVFYIGALGSKKTQSARAMRLKDQGFTDAEIARIHGPIGLAIGAKGAVEIAISVMAEVTQTLRLGE